MKPRSGRSPLPPGEGGRAKREPGEGSRDDIPSFEPSPERLRRSALSRKERAWPRLALIVVVAFTLTACSPKKEEAESGEHVVTVDVAPVLSSPISLKVTADALLYPLQQAAIVPKISSPVKKFYVERGARVGAGQLLAELENRDLAGAVTENQAALDQAEANYQSVSRGTVPEELQKAEGDVRSTKDAMDAQQKIFDSRQTLYREGAIAQKDLEVAQEVEEKMDVAVETAIEHRRGSRT